MADRVSLGLWLYPVYLRVGGDGMLAPDDTPLAESFGFLARLHEQGRFARLGLSGVTVDQIEQARRLAPAAAVQDRFHLLDRGAQDVLRYCEAERRAFVPYFPLAAGMLDPGLDQARLPPGMAMSEEQESALDAVAARHRASRQQIALAGSSPYRRPRCSSPGPGRSTTRSRTFAPARSGSPTTR